MISVRLGRKLLEAASTPGSSHEVNVVKNRLVTIGSTARNAGGASTSHGNTQKWVWEEF
tara:strand:- start:314 stop:490 length:177 start_codon:yes stop_codon:yes gene_type:complete